MLNAAALSLYPFQRQKPQLSSTARQKSSVHPLFETLWLPRIRTPTHYSNKLATLQASFQPQEATLLRTTSNRDARRVRKLRTMRAGDGIRTHDILLGKQTLCQLSYTRKTTALIIGEARTEVKCELILIYRFLIFIRF